MILSVFNNYDKHTSKVDKCLTAICRLERETQVDCPCRDYASAKEMARILVNLDACRCIRLIEIFSTFIRLYRCDETSLRFGAVVQDVTQDLARLQQGLLRP